MVRVPLEAVPDTTANARRQNKPAEDTDDSQMREWRRQWRRIMSVSIFYLDGIDQPSIANIKDHLVLLGSQFQPFFERSVTHVVTRRAVDADYPRNDVIFKAKQLGMKVWSLEKLIRFLTSLLGHPPTKALNATQSAKLSQLLEQEKLVGPADRDPTARRDDYNYFKGPYVMVWDPSHTHRPLLHKEWPRCASIYEGEWPQFRVTPVGMCPFLHDSHGLLKRRKVIDTRRKRRAVEAHTTAKRPRVPETPAEELKENVASPAGPKNDSPLTGNPTGTPGNPGTPATPGNPTANASANFKAKGALGPLEPLDLSNQRVMPVVQEQEQELELHGEPSREPGCEPGREPGHEPEPELEGELEKTDPARDSAEGSTMASAVPTLSKRFCEITASGIQRYSATSAVKSVATAGDGAGNGLGAPQALASRAVANLQRKVMPPGKPPVIVSLNPLKRKAAQPGFCENCMERFDNFDDHIVTKKHRKYAASTHNFAALDSIIQQLERQRL